MGKAREILDGTNLPVAAVAREVGYDDAMYFSRQFTRTHGMPPTPTATADPAPDRRGKRDRYRRDCAGESQHCPVGVAPRLGRPPWRSTR